MGRWIAVNSMLNAFCQITGMASKTRVLEQNIDEKLSVLRSNSAP